MKDTFELLIYGLIVTVFFIILAIQPAFEAHSYNKFVQPGQPTATYWDAAFTSLRVTTTSCRE